MEWTFHDPPPTTGIINIKPNITKNDIIKTDLHYLRRPRVDIALNSRASTMYIKPVTTFPFAFERSKNNSNHEIIELTDRIEAEMNAARAELIDLLQTTGAMVPRVQSRLPTWELDGTDTLAGLRGSALDLSLVDDNNTDVVAQRFAVASYYVALVRLHYQEREELQWLLDVTKSYRIPTYHVGTTFFRLLDCLIEFVAPSFVVSALMRLLEGEAKADIVNDQVLNEFTRDFADIDTLTVLYHPEVLGQYKHVITKYLQHFMREMYQSTTRDAQTNLTLVEGFATTCTAHITQPSKFASDLAACVLYQSEFKKNKIPKTLYERKFSVVISLQSLDLEISRSIIEEGKLIAIINCLNRFSTLSDGLNLVVSLMIDQHLEGRHRSLTKFALLDELENSFARFHMKPNSRFVGFGLNPDTSVSIFGLVLCLEPQTEQFEYIRSNNANWDRLERLYNRVFVYMVLLTGISRALLRISKSMETAEVRALIWQWKTFVTEIALRSCFDQIYSMTHDDLRGLNCTTIYQTKGLISTSIGDYLLIKCSEIIEQTIQAYNIDERLLRSLYDDVVHDDMMSATRKLRHITEVIDINNNDNYDGDLAEWVD
ncbi:hypothetical protein CANCADRAFT_2129 [Tortispora caseinolytica NRRL Y-17796]|uniref:Uncharacterized protein n=1 Tax=Tortispora caseinolytica NRRL Y-17796 TaxID=767744 RepID=A0A1E4TFD6_9ASCO|nr:hypothetical protein CANCADRAFT_2129 [Tortispora caseinolytica NRRL Y-17796]